MPELRDVQRGFVTDLLRDISVLKEGDGIERKAKFVLASIPKGVKTKITSETAFRRVITPQLIFNGKIAVRRTIWGYMLERPNDSDSYLSANINSPSMHLWEYFEQDPNHETRSSQLGVSLGPYIAVPHNGIFIAEARFYAPYFDNR